MNKQTEIARDKAIGAMLMAVAEQNTLDVLQERTFEICKKYFPQADGVMLNTFSDFSYCAQHFNFAVKVLRSEVNRYARENRTGG
jgi:hypothetical protein